MALSQLQYRIFLQDKKLKVAPFGESQIIRVIKRLFVGLKNFQLTGGVYGALIENFDKRRLIDMRRAGRRDKYAVIGKFFKRF